MPCEILSHGTSALRIHAILESSFVNGPGERMVIWFQGCSKGCKGCFNPGTWKRSGGEIWSPSDLASYVRRLNPFGLTLTGGDPLEQADGLLLFLRELNPLAEDFLPGGIILFSGYTIEEIEGIEVAFSCLEHIDVLIDGRFIEELRHVDGLSGSSNQRFHFSSVPGRGRSRVGEESLLTDQAVEIHALGEGVIEVTGFPSIDRKELRRLGLRVID